MRQNLPLTDLSLAVQLFAKNIDDESLPSSIQTMSCKLLLNLVDCIRSKSEQENGNGRDILMRMLEVVKEERKEGRVKVTFCGMLYHIHVALRSPRCLS